MAGPTKNLPFEYLQRWEQVGALFTPALDVRASQMLEEKDRDLEDYLASLSAGACDCAWVIASATGFTDATSTLTMGQSKSPNWTINASGGGTWSASSGAITPPIDDFYQCSVYAGLDYDSGPDPSKCSVILGSSHSEAPVFIQSDWAQDAFGANMTASGTFPQVTGTNFYTTVSSGGPFGTVRQMSLTLAWFTAITFCGCVPPAHTGGG